MSWRKTNSTRQGTTSMYGAADFNVLMDLLNGVNTGQAVTINNAWNFTLAPTGNIVADNSITTAKLVDASVTSAKIANGAIVDADVNASAAIAYSKLNLANSVTGTDIAANTITDADISATAAITKTKLALSNSILNADVNSAAAIAYSKLALSNSIVNADIAAAAAIAKSKLANLAIVDADVASGAAIAHSKVGTNLQLSESGLTGVRTWTFPDGSGQIAGVTATQTLTGKTIRAEDNTFISVYTNPLIKRTGAVLPGQGSSTNSIRAEGVLAFVTAVGAGSLADGFDTTEGKTTIYTSTAAANVNAGITGSGSGFGVGRRLFGMRFVERGKVDQHTASRYYFGFTSATSIPISDTPLANTDNGALMGFRSTDTNYQAFTNNAGGAMTATDLGVAIDANFHTLEINWSAAGNVNFILDGATTTVSTTLPTTSANLFVNNVAQTTATATAVVHTSKGMWIAADK